ncbi:hypothetical protein ASPVEDRAFT_155827 [Aspergillus versicolor CBS 583.65]|uniref:Small ribosomal subunit protein mS33 n=1 Tax=Aspergillus versicolor CBS 583.65 TaxID=1036611 RepID=A0A1L9Q2W1_ASPVE|nr:uncharacterized protein ASPVEDRAFT_155827 [Aspergillus versicolor CBS 583.65]OJJ08104.1 hypothetical protein ASPVEDRAFT_155827 [Aspergillus versicolor CBS 583.65]
MAGQYSRLLDLAKVHYGHILVFLYHNGFEYDGLMKQVQCRVFSMNFNPDGLRLGNKVLRQRLRGPTLASWYPRKVVSFRDLRTTCSSLGLTAFDEVEDDREEAIQIAKLRGKGRPKKKRTAAESRSAKKKK